jgi:diacylglycerol kinase (ATP)
MSVAIIINPRSGGGPLRGRERAERASAVLSTLGVAGEIFLTERKGHARELAAAALARGVTLVAAWGGDGTVNEVACALLASQSGVLAIVPSGSGNGLARELAIAGDPARNLSEALRAVPRFIDTGELNGRPFVSIAGIGFDAHVAACFDRDPSGRRGLSTYARVTARELRGYAPREYRVDGQLMSRVLLSVANSAQFGNGARIAPGARLDDGLLNLVVFEERSRFATITAVPRLFLGGVASVRGISTRAIVQTTIEADLPIVCHTDGEPVEAGTRVEVRVRPRSLRVAVR